jgi:hypothetical protein
MAEMNTGITSPKQKIIHEGNGAQPLLESSFIEVIEMIQQTRQQAFQLVNTALIDLIGVSVSISAAKWNRRHGVKGSLINWRNTSIKSIQRLRVLNEPTCFGCEIS